MSQNAWIVDINILRLPTGLTTELTLGLKMKRKLEYLLKILSD